MTETLKQTCWQEFLSFIEDKCSKAEYNNWFVPIRYVEQKQDSIVLEVPNIFVREYLIDNYKNELADFLPKDLKGNPSIEFIFREEKVQPKSAITLEAPKKKTHTR